MSWIQENKFVAGLIGVTAVIGGGIVYFGISQGGAYNGKVEEYEELKAKYAKLEKATPYPNKENLEKRESGIAQYEKSIHEVSDKLGVYGPDTMDKLSPEEFTAARVKASNNLRQAFEGAGTKLPSVTDFGFEAYSNDQAKSAATPKLTYQLGATEWLLTKLANVKPSAVTNINRIPLAVESGEQAEEPVSRGRSRTKSKTVDSKPYETMPMELSFTADESAVRDFLKEMVSSDKYFYAIRALRVRNEKQLPPSANDANFAKPAAVSEGGSDQFSFEGLVEPSEDTASDQENKEEPPVVSERILKQVLGSEELHVHIVFDILLFNTKLAATAEAK